MKTCSRCRRQKPFKTFGKNASKRDGRQTYCKGCNKGRLRLYYRASPRKQVERNRHFRHGNAKKLLQYLLKHPCVDCGETDIVVLEFDHVRGRKVAAVTELVATGYSWSTIEKEIKKCVVRCSNDHRRATARRQNSFRYSSVAQR